MVNSLYVFQIIFVWNMIDEVFNFTFYFSDDIFVRPKTPAKKVTDMDNLAG
jgi:hypothetical protein